MTKCEGAIIQELRTTLEHLYRPAFLALLGLCALSAASSLLLFHVLAEFITVFIGAMIFVFSWYGAGRTGNRVFFLLGSGYLWVAALDTLHTLAYQGMNVLPDSGANTATQLWLAARYLEALVLLSLPFAANRAMDRNVYFVAIGVPASLAAMAILSGHFPDAFLPEIGLTPFKIGAEYIVCGLFVLAIWRFHRNRDQLQVLYWPLVVATGLTITSEIAFTLYVDVHGLSNMAGHALKLASFYVLFLGVVDIGLTKPAETLAREMAHRRETEAALEQERKRLDEIIRGTNAGTWEWNVQTGETRFNEQWANICGYGLAELEPVSIDTWTALCHPKDLELAQKSLERHFNGETPFYDTTTRMRHKQGHWVWIHDRGTVVEWTATGEPLRMSGTHLDITERMEFEQKLKVAREAAEGANRAKSDFLASMSHELRTPLNAILGFGQMLEMIDADRLTDKQREYVGHIISSGHNLLELINDILDLAKIEANRLSIFLEPLTVGDVVEDCVSQMAPLCLEHGIRIENRIDGDTLPPCQTDRLRFRQTLINLLTNAVKYNKENGDVVVTAEETPDAYLRVAVADTGVGIPKDKRGRVFTLFERIDNNPSVAATGTGIGLAVSKMLVERMGGRIGFDSTPGEGSTFWIDLPLESNDQILIWSEKYRVGIDAIDRDHQIIFELTNKVSQPDLTEQAMHEVIQEMIAYTRYHFRREETIMSACGYPELDAHMRYHRNLEDRIDGLAAQYKQTTDPQTLMRLRSFLRNWWSGHIMDVDTTIAKHAAGKETAIKIALEKLERNREEVETAGVTLH
ncbi:MAG: hypothetical protein CMM61_03525 [Rhodospirillaceae bacterium]|nr:hypothetical protein [Rhodospirillaceae bacterium]